MPNPLLSICVPTYNRPIELAERIREFLFSAATNYPEEIEVRIRDNSSLEIGETNRRHCIAPIHYTRNETNVGYHGNLYRLLADAAGTYVWVVSDDDMLVADELSKLLEILRRAHANQIAAVTIDYTVINEYGDIHTVPGDGGTFTNPCKLHLLAKWENGQLPFVLLSSAIVRNDKAAFQRAKNAIGNNDLAQVGLFCAAIGAQGCVVASRVPILEYRTPLRGRFAMKGLFEHHIDVARFCSRELGVAARSPLAKEYLLNLIHHRADYLIISNADAEMHWFINESLKNAEFVTWIKVIILRLPRIILRKIYPYYRAYSCSSKHLSYFARVRRVRRRQRENHHSERG